LRTTSPLGIVVIEYPVQELSHLLYPRLKGLPVAALPFLFRRRRIDASTDAGKQSLISAFHHIYIGRRDGCIELFYIHPGVGISE
jgi:hypothetical protein